jgi:hypothetical protein
MASRPVSVSAEIQVFLMSQGTNPLPVLAELTYDASDPYAVTVAFRTAAGAAAVQWTFARQLLTDGVTAPAGEGDVRTWPESAEGDPVVRLSLTSPSGNALFELPVPELVEFLTMTYAAVPSGGEASHVDLDTELAALLGAGPEA